MNAHTKIDTGIVDIRGKQYQTVALRVQMFRQAHPEHGLNTAVIARDDDCVVMQAQISDATGRVVATGHAEENRKSSQINRTSALENAETSAIGRALAAFGFGGTEFATANEVANAIHQQDAAGGHSGKGAQSAPGGNLPHTGEPAPRKREKLDGPYTSKTALWTAFKALDRELRGCGDSDEFEIALKTEEAVALIEQLERDAPNLVSGGSDLPEEYVPLNDLIAQRRYDFEQLAKANHIADIARA